ncbi:hypothetical protein BZG35_07900 [Brevundimonas sp. LM2]|uniref:DUF5615 family PIN-like protein n=1 Tax=Brevundimonas sp. LM2 TaxID=1938605 RepID=UPI000983BE5B|nr:DUF5615 family PIN-like protein [Brevundimonas sp. LM2]AQR61584.1 hypothetical protein BZG35_07900 [Brevundimonas sp. LM2]
MKIIIDQQLPPVLARWLRDEHDIDAVHVREIRLKDAPDHDIWLEAKRRGAVVISRDADFANFARQDVAGRLVWLRIGNCTNPELIAVFEAIWPIVWARLLDGERFVELRND